jgi:geranylgeranylglycerol-phosphate geranylgeranyltransferase
MKTMIFARTSILPYLKIARMQNVLLAGAAVALGFWLSHSVLSIFSLLLLMLAAIAATAFGNSINDLYDIATDRISHPNRPLPLGEMSVRAAWIYSAVLAFTAVIAASLVSYIHAIATFIPLVLLAIYTRYLKGTPFAGNVLVSLLVAYALLFGGLSAPFFSRLLIPAILAFLLNCSREIIKTIQDAPGDRAQGLVTAAAIPMRIVKTVVYSISCVYLLLLFLPWLLSHFGPVYAGVCMIGILPLQFYWLALFVRKEWRNRLPLMATLIKWEMLIGLLALALDQLFSF